MIPNGGEYLKLGIKPTYTVSRNNTLPDISGIFGGGRSVGSRLKAVVGIADFKVSIVIENSLLPIWAVAGNVGKLGKHFPWMRQLALEMPDLYKPDSDQFLSCCVQFQEALISHGWAFAIQLRAAVCFAGNRSALNALRKEFNGAPMNPVDLTLDVANADTFSTYRSDGTRLKSIPISELGIAKQDPDDSDELDNVEEANLARRLVNQDKKRDFAGWINGLHRRGGLSVLDFCNLPESEFGRNGHTFWARTEDWDGISEQAIKSVFSQKNFEKRASEFPRVASILSNEIDQALSGAIAYANLKGFDIGWKDGKLFESSFRSLLQDTKANGQYRIGGMRLLQGRWVYDTAVPGRTENARFVFTRRPTLTVDQDGLPIYSFSFMSRWNRNTTGMRHTGYVKFIKPKSGILARIKRYLFLDQMDLDVHVKCSCLEGSALVLMADGTQKPISQVRVGDMVTTHKGRARKVTAVQSRQVRPDENVYRMKTEASPDPFIITGEHPMLVLRGMGTCACGCGQPLPLTEGRWAWSPEIMLARKCIQGHGGIDPTVEKGKKRVRSNKGVLGPSNTRKTAESFIGQAKLIHGSRYDYSQTNYEKATKKVAILCRDHGQFTKLPSMHLAGAGCPVCAKEVIRQKATEQGKRRVKLPDPVPSFKMVPVDDLRKHEWGLSAWPEAPAVPRDVDPNFARLIGYYAAEGCFSTGNTVVFSFNINEWGTLAKDVVDAARTLGYRASRWRPKAGSKSAESNGCTASVCDRGFKAACLKLAGRYSHHKRLAPEVVAWSDEAVKHLLTGMILGDGSIDKDRGRIRYMSVSRDLADQASFLLSRLRLRNTVSYAGKQQEPTWHYSRREKRMVKLIHSDIWQVCLAPEAEAVIRPLMEQYEATDKPRCSTRKYAGKFVPEQGQLRKVLERELVQVANGQSQVEGLIVWDLTVEEDHSFTVHGVQSSNCPDFKYRWHKALADAGAAATPSGIGGEATNVDPHKTNPGKLRSVCKHLAAFGPFIQASAREHDKLVKALVDPRFETKGEGKAKAVKPNAKLMSTSPL